MSLSELIPHLPPMRRPDQVEMWVASLVARYRALRQHDKLLSPESETDLPAGEAMRGEWQALLHDAEALAAQADARFAMPGPGEKTKAVEIAVGYGDLQTIIKIARMFAGRDLRESLARVERFRAGEVETMSMEEVRRELRRSRDTGGGHQAQSA